MVIKSNTSVRIKESSGNVYMKFRQKCKNDPTLFLVANLKELMHLLGKFYMGILRKDTICYSQNLFIEMLLFTCQGGFQLMHICKLDNVNKTLIASMHLCYLCSHQELENGRFVTDIFVIYFPLHYLL